MGQRRHSMFVELRRQREFVFALLQLVHIAEIWRLPFLYMEFREYETFALDWIMLAFRGTAASAGRRKCFARKWIRYRLSSGCCGVFFRIPVCGIAFASDSNFDVCACGVVCVMVCSASAIFRKAWDQLWRISVLGFLFDVSWRQR